MASVGTVGEAAADELNFLGGLESPCQGPCLQRPSVVDLAWSGDILGESWSERQNTHSQTDSGLAGLRVQTYLKSSLLKIDLESTVGMHRWVDRSASNASSFTNYWHFQTMNKKKTEQHSPPTNVSR